MDRETLTSDEQAARLWSAWGPEAFTVIQRRIDDARDRMLLDDAHYWLDVETRAYLLSGERRAAA